MRHIYIEIIVVKYREGCCNLSYSRIFLKVVNLRFDAVRTLPVANHYTRYKVVVAIKYSIIYYLTVLNLGCLKSDY